MCNDGSICNPGWARNKEATIGACSRIQDRAGSPQLTAGQLVVWQQRSGSGHAQKSLALQEQDAAACTFTPCTRTMPEFIQKLAAARADAHAARKAESTPIAARYYTTLNSTL